jgi:hypothetical protein
MEPLAVVGQEGSGSEVINLKVDRLELRVFFAVNVLGVWGGLALGNVSDIR